MPLSLDEYVKQIQPENTILLLGAGAAIPSGGPSGVGLARQLAGRLHPAPDGDDLTEVAGIFENRRGRRELADAVREFLSGLQPTGGLLAIPAFNWRAVYSTNFDQLIETAYRRAGKELTVVRSNYDYSRQTSQNDTVLFKIHGCVSQDVGYGDRSRMTLTESDYDEVRAYRQTLFNSLQMHMGTADTLIIGQSLKDAHLRDLAKEVSALRVQGIPGRVLLLVYEFDEDRAQLLEQRGIIVIPGGLDDFMHRLGIGFESKNTGPAHVFSTSTSSARNLKPSLAAVTIDVEHSLNLSANPIRLFNGSPATYADIRQGFTIDRAVKNRLQDYQQGPRGYFTVLAGAAGVGKTSLARSILLKRVDEEFLCWEHRNEFPLDWSAWVEVESTLRKEGRQGVLLIDDCAEKLTAVNRLVDALGAIHRPSLRIVLTANLSQWKTRTKSQYFFSRGNLEHISSLTTIDIERLVTLLDRQVDIRQLVEGAFLQLSRSEKIRRLRDRCSADMFVCLKNIFRNENLDNILLQEFSSLQDQARDIYRHVAAIQAMGGKVHRQLIVRLLGIDVLTLQALLNQMEDVVSEYSIRETIGLYGWTSRHDVIANIIATYKFAEQDDLFRLLSRLIDGLVPSNYLEIETARAIASHDMGIGRISDLDQQATLFQQLIKVVPGERIPRRRLIKLYLKRGELVEADQAISAFVRDIGTDNIIDRYKCQSAIQRAENTEGLLDEDRNAMLREAERIARVCIRNQPADRYNYRALASVGIALARRTGNTEVLSDAIELIRSTEAAVLDPEFAYERRTFEATLRQLAAEATSQEKVEDLEAETNFMVDSA